MGRKERKGKKEEKGNFLLQIQILKDFHFSAPLVSTLPLLGKEHFYFLASAVCHGKRVPTWVTGACVVSVGVCEGCGLCGPCGVGLGLLSSGCFCANCGCG